MCNGEKTSVEDTIADRINAKVQIDHKRAQERCLTIAGKRRSHDSGKRVVASVESDADETCRFIR